MDRAREFAEYVGALAMTLEHADRIEPLQDYCRGLMLSADRKSVEPMAALLAPKRASAKHQSLHHFVAKARMERRGVAGAGASAGAARNWVRSRHGSSMTRAIRRRAHTRSELRVNIAGSLASRTIAKSP